MTVSLDKINAAPLRGENFTFDFNTWVSVLVDTLNETIRKLQENIVSFETVTNTSQSVEVNTQYIVGNAATTTFELPDTATVGDEVQIVGLGAGGWVLEPGAGQTIKVLASSAAVSVASTNRYDCISIVCVEEDTTWVTRNSQTAGFTIT